MGVGERTLQDMLKECHYILRVANLVFQINCTFTYSGSHSQEFCQKYLLAAETKCGKDAVLNSWDSEMSPGGVGHGKRVKNTGRPW